MSPVPVCSKPNCQHSAETDPARLDLCNAYFRRVNYYGGQVFWSDGRIFVYAASFERDGVSLFEVSPDGSSRRDLIHGLTKYAITPDCMAVHRGKFYVAETVYDEEMNAASCIKAYSLDGHRQGPEIIFDRDPTIAYITNLRIFDNTLNFWAYSSQKSLADMGYIAYHIPLPNGKPELDLDIPHGSEANRRDDGTFSYLMAGTDAENAMPFAKLEIRDPAGNLLVSQDLGYEHKGVRGLYVSPFEHAFIVDVSRVTLPDGSKKVMMTYYYFDKGDIPTGEVTLRVLLQQEME
ncbi:MAG: hypothetical protein ACI4QB_08055 [Eubacteriales bacterium]